MCNDRLWQPCRQRLQLRREARRGTVAAILSHSVMHPSCMHLSHPQSHLAIHIVSCRHLLSVLVCTCASVRVCVCVIEKCVRVCFGAAFPSCVCRWMMDCRKWIAATVQALDITASWLTSRHSCRHLSLHCLCATSMLRAS